MVAMAAKSSRAVGCWTTTATATWIWCARKSPEHRPLFGDEARDMNESAMLPRWEDGRFREGPLSENSLAPKQFPIPTNW